MLTSNPLDLMAASGRVYSGIRDILVSVGRNVAPESKTVSCGRQDNYKLLRMSPSSQSCVSLKDMSMGTPLGLLPAVPYK